MLARWLRQVWRGEIDIGEVYLRCGKPHPLNLGTDVGELADDVMGEIRGARVTSTYHLRCFLSDRPELAADLNWLRTAIEARGGRVIESRLKIPAVGPQTQLALRAQWMHHFFDDALHRFAGEPAVLHYIMRNGGGNKRVRAASEDEDSRLDALLDALFEPVARTYAEVEALAGEWPAGAAGLDAAAVLADRPGLHRPYVLAALDYGLGG